MKLKNVKFFTEHNYLEILKTLLIITWIIITIVSLLFNLRKQEDKIVIIRETPSGNYIIPEENHKKENDTDKKQSWDSVVDAESLHKVNFIKRYFALIYNFDKSSIEDQFSKGTDLMSASLYEKSLQDLNALKEGVLNNKENLTQSFEIMSITKVSPLVFDIDGRISTVKDGKDYRFDYVIKLALREANKTKLNPWGWEVENVAETRK
jgi:hypothetical protein